jgi:hypothetical protein
MPPAARFPASYDRTTKIISAVISVMLLGIALVLQSALGGAIALLPVLLCLLTVLLSYGLSPRGYVVSNRSIIINRLLGNIHVSLEGAREARKATGDDLGGCFRLWGSGGMFGYYGLFQTSRLGTCSWYVTARERTVVVVTGSKTVLFSPDDVEGFLAAIRAEVPVPEQAVTGSQAVPSSRAALWVGLGVGAGALAIVAAALLYSPGPPRYTLGGDSLSIHDRFYPVTVRASDVDVERIRIVDVRHDPEWRTTLRTNGFSNAHYHSGWFRVASGTKVRMYRADSTRLVLIPPKGEGASVLLEAADPDALAAELRRKWARP